jgi:hypothetical protein
MYSTRDKTLRFAYVTSLLIEGNETHVGLLRNPKTLPRQELRQRATKYCRWETMFIVWTIYSSLLATPPTRLIPLPFISNGRLTHRFAPTTPTCMETLYVRNHLGYLIVNGRIS